MSALPNLQALASILMKLVIVVVVDSLVDVCRWCSKAHTILTCKLRFVQLIEFHGY